MSRLLFLPTPNTLVWLEVPLSPEELLAAIERGDWTPPLPFEHIPIASLQVVCQGDLVTITARPAAPDALPKLSPRQQEVLSALIEGLTYRQIAHRLKLTPRMVKYHMAELKTRLGAGTRDDLLIKGRAWLAVQSAQTAAHT